MKKISFLLFISLLTSSLFGAKLDTIMIYSASMDKEIPNLVILPDAYEEGQALPVVYLLHGAGGNHLDWYKKVPLLPTYADLYDFIIVCPDGAKTSWYYDSPVDESMRYETYVTSELITYIDANYKTVADRKGRAISGLSMGGHGAFFLSFRHQDLYGAAGSTSGGVDVRGFPLGWDLPLRLGDRATHPQNWEDHAVINQVYLLKKDNLKLIFDCGYDDFFFNANQRLHQKLVDNNIPHDYTVRPGAHNNEYWKNSIKYHFLYFAEFFK